MTTIGSGIVISNSGPGMASASNTITVSGISTTGGITTLTIPATSANQWISKLKMEPGIVHSAPTQQTINLNSSGNLITSIPGLNNGGAVVATVASPVPGSTNNNNNMTLDCYEDMFKEITKKLYGDESVALVDTGDATTTAGSIQLYDPGDTFQTLVSTNGLPPGTIVVQRRVQDDKGMPQTEHLAFTTVASAPASTAAAQIIEERWFESDEILTWTASKIARYNPAQKVFRCVDCDFVGFLSRVAEHWLGNHASLRVFQCPRCPYTSAWARCVRMHLTRQHGEVLTDNSLWKENPVLEEVTKFLNTLKTRVEQKVDTSIPGEKRYTCQYCSYATDRRDLFNRHENIHRDEKPFQCFVCEKQFNRADHVKKHFTRMHREHTYDINRIRKHVPKAITGTTIGTGVSLYQSKYTKDLQFQQNQQQQQILAHIQDSATGLLSDGVPIQLQTLQTANGQTITLQQIPNIAFNFNTTTSTSSSVAVPAQSQATTQSIATTVANSTAGIQGVGGDKKGNKNKNKTGIKKKKQGDKMYTCSYCPWQGVDNWCLKRHLNTHIKPFLCTLCDYKAARSERLATHVLKVHNKRVCHKCSFLADDPESLAQHVQDSHQNPLVKTGFNCNLCQEYFELRADLEAHAILEHQKVIVQCDLCDFRTTDELSMEAHLRDKHNLQPGMGAVAAAAAAAAAAHGVTPSPQVQITQQIPQQALIQIQEQLAAAAAAAASQQSMQLNTEELPTPQIQSQLILPDQTIVKQEGPPPTFQIHDETIRLPTLSLPPPEMDVEREPETSCDYCGCEFVDEPSAKTHQKSHEPKGYEPIELRNSKIISRLYTCSTCSYNSATSKIMMQHQRVHSGSELECKVAHCSFSSPFDNSLKEHVYMEHHLDYIRCPHCGHQAASLVDFTFHWRIAHHPTVCSLCIHIYKTKYGMKEPEIHELLLRSPLEMLEFKKESLQAALASNAADADGDNSNPGLPSGPSTIMNEGEPIARRASPQALTSVFTSLTNLLNHPSVWFLPKYVDLTVSTMGLAQIQRHQLQDQLSRLNKHSNLNNNTRTRFLRSMLRRLISTRTYHNQPILTRRRTNGKKCFLFSSCRNKSHRYPNLSKFYLHRAWHHHPRTSQPQPPARRVKCDYCDTWYTHTYQALLHIRRSHPRATNTTTLGLGSFEMEFNNNGENDTRIIFKQEI